MPQIRALGATYRCMQRLGFLKCLSRRVVAMNSASLDNLGADLIQTVSHKARVPLNPIRVTYVKRRLYDRVYSTLKKQTLAWSEGEPLMVGMELQDLYLADSVMGSQTGKLVREDWRRYPPLGVAIGLIREGTYSPTTRTLSLLHFTPQAEQDAFLKYQPERNPLLLTRAQALLLLYSFLQNDGEVMVPLLCRISRESSEGFTDRQAGDELPTIYRALINRHRRRLLPVDERARLDVLSSAADNIEKWRDKPYSGSGARDEAVTVRLEPYVDMGLFTKPDPFRYLYAFSEAGRIWTQALQDVESDEEIGDFLSSHYFSTAAQASGIQAQTLADTEAIVSHMYRAWQGIRSTGGYAPIEEMALVAGIRALEEHGLIIELGEAREAIIAYQKAHPYQVRFTVNRMGILAHARFLEEPARGAIVSSE